MTNPRFYITSFLILLFLAGVFYFLNRHFNRLETQDNREYELSQGELNRKIQNDSAKHIIDSLETANKILADNNEKIERQKSNARTIFIQSAKEHTNLSASRQGELLIRKIDE